MPKVHPKIVEAYAKIPDVHCKGLCTAQCSAVICTRAERAIANPNRLPLGSSDGMTCPLLVEGRCASYKNRPFTCRMFGATTKMRCPHGCVPTMTDEAADELARTVLAADTDLVQLAPYEGRDRQVSRFLNRTLNMARSRSKNLANGGRE